MSGGDAQGAGVVLPHSTEAEQAVLGALLIDSDMLHEVADMLRPEAFFHAAHRAVYAEIVAQVGKGQTPDIISVGQASGHDLVFLNALTDAVGVVTPKRLRNHAGLIGRHWQARELVRLADGLKEKALECNGEGVLDIANAVAGKLLDLQQAAATSEPVHITQLAAELIDHVERMADGDSSAMATGLQDLDRLTGGGGRAGELWVIGARPSMGKTAFTGTLARNVSRKTGALFVSLEDSGRALTARHFAALGEMNLADLRNPSRAPQDFWSKLADAAEQASALSLWIDDAPLSTVADVRRRALAVKRKHPLGLLVVDYLQLMDDEGDNRNIMLGKIANGMKRMAKELGLWIIVLSQLNREADKRSGAPIMSDLRDSGDIEGAADVIGLLYREHCRNPTDENKRHAELHVVKHKNGACETVNLTFDGATQRMTDWYGPPPSRIGRGAPRSGYSGGLS